jgi:hypothetical protein
MGSLLYGASMVEVTFEDRVLAHLQVVMSAKLRRGETFFFTWLDDPAIGGARNAAWISPATPLYFRYSGSRPPALNREWLEQLAISAGSNEGLVLQNEPGIQAPVAVTANSVKRPR